MSFDDLLTGPSSVGGSKLALGGNIVGGAVGELAIIVDPGTFWFSPPTGRFRVPPRRRLDALGVPRSRAYRNAFFRTQIAEELEGEGSLVVAGIRYPGGRWYGPLTSAQITALTEAGYEDRIVEADTVGEAANGRPS